VPLASPCARLLCRRPLLAQSRCRHGKERGEEKKQEEIRMEPRKDVLPVRINKQKGSVRIRKRRREEQMDFPKDLNANTENCRGLTVKQNFPLI
jgi:hypothetical protein